MNDFWTEVWGWVLWAVLICGTPRVFHLSAYLLFRRETRRWLRATHREAKGRKEKK